MKKKLYLANPYGFSKQTKSLLNEFINIFNGLNIEVYEPFERTKQIMQKQDNWAYKLAESNFNDLKKCDCIFAIVNGTPPDEGVMIELGIAIALKKIGTYFGKLKNTISSFQREVNSVTENIDLEKDTTKENLKKENKIKDNE